MLLAMSRAGVFLIFSLISLAGLIKISKQQWAVSGERNGRRVEGTQEAFRTSSTLDSRSSIHNVLSSAKIDIETRP